MAFQLGHEIPVPISLEGTYLIPVSWLWVAHHEGYVSIDSGKFDNSLQGAIYDWFFESNVERKLPMFKETTQEDLWLVYHSERKGIVDYFYVQPYKMIRINSDRVRSGFVIVANCTDIFNGTSSFQKGVNGSIIQLFPGCGVTLERKVWTSGEKAPY